MLKGLFYHFSPGKDIGHGVHLFRLAARLNTLCETGAEFTLLRDSGSYPPKSLWTYGPHIPLCRPAARNITRRQKTILSAFPERGLDFLLTAFFPFGRTACGREILPALKKAKVSGAAIYASVPMPYFSHSEKDLERLFYFAGFYDRIFIHCPPGFDLKYMASAVPFEGRISSARFLEVFKKLKQKICFTGYVVPGVEKSAPKSQGGGFILVHRGGGSTSPDIVTCAILAKERVKSGLPITVVAGPASTAAEMRSWRGLMKKRKVKGVRLLKTADNFFERIADCEICSGTAGGTVYEALYWNKKMVLIPFKGAPKAEHSDQLARSAMLKKLAGAIVLDYDTLTPEGLAGALDKAILAPRPVLEPDPDLFDGASVFARTILEDLCSRR
ncbi:MAG: hypothetical protein A2270_09595 [Elusimicrobia bacterium RIFOXYA12_FULL_51_18]|nr:MAG: hypothetical protein A2270_09595 [Elusimicrobia bacterium RIFOXYA12_FULL_51_18]OGS32755.1 MAG: hypothetical protein A2218_11910 [Elusimicrobia bacterium RIFOXYA2_FULL_53_38]